MASLARPSPSSTTMSRRGRPSRRAIASGATTSGGATIAPSTKPTAHGRPSSQCAAAATAQVGEHDAADREQRDRPQVEAELAPAHGDAGRIDQRRQDAPAAPAPAPARCAAGRGSSASTTPATTSRIDGAVLSRRARDRDHHQHREQQEQNLDGRGHGAGGVANALAARLTVSAMIVVVNTNATMPWTRTSRRTCLLVTPTSDTWKVIPMTKAK